MSKLKSLRTYSKTQKVVEYSTLFSDVPTSSNNDLEEEIPKETGKRQTRKRLEKIDSLEEKNNEVKENLNSRTSLRRKRENSKVNSSEDITETVKALPKRKARADFKATSQSKNSDFENEKNQNNSKISETSTKSIKLFQFTESHVDCSGETNEEIEKNSKKASNSKRTSARAQSVATNKMKSLKTSASSSNLVTKNNNANKKTAAKNSAENKENQICLKKFRSASSINPIRNEFPVENKDNILEESKEKNQIKSIIKEPSKKTSKKSQEALDTIDRPKRSVRLLENIDDKNDELTNLQLDNKTKYKKSTSTPSGIRRKPLKQPQDISMISKS